MTIVFDASTVLAILKGEPGSDAAVAKSRGALLSSVNLIEIRSKLMDAVYHFDAMMIGLARLELEIVPFSEQHAIIAAELWPSVKGRNVSLADRACLALAIERNAQVVSGDRDWADLGLELDIQLFR